MSEEKIQAYSADGLPFINVCDAIPCEILVDCSLLNPSLGLKPGMSFIIDVGSYQGICCKCAEGEEVPSAVRNIQIRQEGGK